MVFCAFAAFAQLLNWLEQARLPAVAKSGYVSNTTLASSSLIPCHVKPSHLCSRPLDPHLHLIPTEINTSPGNSEGQNEKRAERTKVFPSTSNGLFASPLFVIGDALMPPSAPVKDCKSVALRMTRPANSCSTCRRRRGDMSDGGAAAARGERRRRKTAAAAVCEGNILS